MRFSRSGVWRLLTLAIVLAAALAFGCGDDDDDDNGDDDDDDNDDNDNDDNDDLPCDEARRPIVYAHGYIDSGDTFANSAMRFASNGYCADRIFAFDWNSLSFDFDAHIQGLALFIDSVLGDTGAQQVDLVGHSMGSGLAAAYLNRGNNALKVAHYAHIAGLDMDTLPGGVPTMTISSKDDPIAGPSEITGAENVKLEGADHLQTVTTAESFENLFRFFNDGEIPATGQIVPDDEVSLLGRIVTLGDNLIRPGYQVNVYPYDPIQGARKTTTPVATFVGDEGGYFGPFDAEPDVHYEFEVLPNSEDQIPVHYYRQPQPRTNRLFYLRTMPEKTTAFGAFFWLYVPFGDDHAVFVSFTANQSTISGRDELFVDGIELSTPEMATRAMSTIAIFMFDLNRDEQSQMAPADGLVGFILKNLPFLQTFDYWVPSKPATTVEFEFNNQRISVPNLPSKTGGVALAVFD